MRSLTKSKHLVYYFGGIMINRCRLMWVKKRNKDLANSELIVLKDTGHALPEERPLEVFEYIKGFIDHYKTAAEDA